ncbi:MAG: RsmB/NOP family class I SAM-dependent RNA methyltransferase [Candidatus Calescibacterium sp.]|nr:RsmB/NOP family class I SAM-dependent RNA methyltransferase [Candidatus Calescibacterium sp.]
MSYREILEEYDFIEDKERFWKNLNTPKPSYFRINILKHDKEKIVSALKRYPNLEFEEIKTLDNYYIVKKGNISKKPEHLFGYLYIQDISSALVVNMFNKKTNPSLIIDMCASPGGKTTLLSTIFPNSLIIANDMDRIKSLVHNVQRIGSLNVLITQCNARFFPFIINKEIDSILVDAPCSAESNLDNYENYNTQKHRNFIEYITKIQYEILNRATKISNKNTEIVYSTCTFNPMENEYIIDKLVKEQKIVVSTLPNLENLNNIHKGLVNYKDIEFDKSLSKTLRIYPENMKGMFISKILPTKYEQEKNGSTAKILNLDDKPIFQNHIIQKISNEIVLSCLDKFGIQHEMVNRFIWFHKDKEKISDIYVSSTDLFLVKEKGPLKVEHFGLKAFRYFKPMKTYKPTSSFLTIIGKYITKNFVELRFDLNLLKKFLMREEIELNQFEQIEIDNSYPFVAVKFNGLVIGCGILKNGKIFSEIPISKSEFFLNII